MRKFGEFYLNHELLIGGTCLVTEPINTVIKKLEVGKAVIVGPRRSGKTTTALTYKQRINSKMDSSIVIYEQLFNGISTDKIALLDDKVSMQYIELEMANELYNFIKERDINYYFSNCEDKHKAIMKDIETTRDFIVNGESDLEPKYKTGELSFNIILTLKKYLGINNMILIVDKLDYQTPEVQEMVFKYLPIFNNHIFLLNDESFLANKANYNKFKSKGYNVIDLEYSKKVHVVKEIVNRRIAFFNSNNPDVNLKNIEDILLKHTIEKTFDVAGGNIDTVLIASRVACDYLIGWKEQIGSERVTDAYLHNLHIQTFDRDKVMRMYPKSKLDI